MCILDIQDIFFFLNSVQCNANCVRSTDQTRCVRDHWPLTNWWLIVFQKKYWYVYKCPISTCRKYNKKCFASLEEELIEVSGETFSWCNTRCGLVCDTTRIFLFLTCNNGRVRDEAEDDCANKKLEFIWTEHWSSL